MPLDWDWVSKLLFPILTAVVVAAINKRIENRPKLVTYMAHAAGFLLPTDQESQRPAMQGGESSVPPSALSSQVNVHSVIVRNTGKKTAFNVRIGHNLQIPHYVIEPPVQHESKVTTPGGWEIIVPAIVPNEQIMVSYLYFPPITWHRINAYTKSDEGVAQYLNVLPTPHPPRWAIVGYVTMFYIGVLAIAYGAVVGIQWIVAVTHSMSLVR
ncbi:hypothetical protein [Ralstonia solanacearum]|uniref:hypothetical protein n=1 Tax=Ralstonia solanacearum TaxID=305 RepID=UPI0001D94B83|nr:hypothetical protein [Ralstonia solanacearum]CBJ43016.1 protein of unknown function [Ralstonia solanacearum CFBP2957]